MLFRSNLFSIIGKTCFCLLFALFFGAVIYANERTSFNEGWRFQKNDPVGAEGKLAYDQIKDWVRASGNEFVLTSDAVKAARPAGNLGADVSYTAANFDDSNWRQLNLPHDWAIEGDFVQELPG